MNFNSENNKYKQKKDFVLNAKSLKKIKMEFNSDLKLSNSRKKNN